MGLQDSVSAERVHISFFGMRNAGKSSMVNAITGQQLSIVSAVKGTTTDPVKRAMELLPLGPVVIIDTPGLDDEGELGHLRVQKAKQVLELTDIAVLVLDKTEGVRPQEEQLIAQLEERRIPYVLVFNKCDLPFGADIPQKEGVLYASAHTGEGIDEVKAAICALVKDNRNEKVLVRDLVEAGDIVVLVTPIDEAAPKGRLILPQQLVIRDILDAHGVVVTCQDTELLMTLAALSKKPRLVITDSQVFERVAKDVPADIALTSFSILMARYKGDLKELVRGAATLSKLKDGAKVLISEGCTHHRQCNDIGTVKMPNWIKDYSGAEAQFLFTSGGEFPEDLAQYSAIVHCGGCTLNETEMKNRIRRATEAGVPIVNYGIAIAHMHGILKRSVELFADVVGELE